MGKKKIIGFLMGVVMTCATASVVSACDSSGDSSGTNSSSSSSVQTPVSVEYKVTFDSAGGASVKAQYVTKGEKAQKPAENPTREGYTFVEWQLNGNAYDFNTAVVGDITLKAKWEKNEPTKFVVSFMVEGESTPFYTAEIATGKKAMKPAEVPTRAGYVFDCWTLNGVEFDFETPITQEVTLVAKWRNLWTITYDAGEETPFYTAETVDGGKATAPTEVPTRVGYVFDYWTLDGVEFDFETPVTQALTLVAEWAVARKVTFDVGEGNSIDPAIVKDGGTVSAPDAEREGYYVTGWLLNGETFDFTTPITEDITLTAVWDTDGLYSNQIGIRICGNDVSGQSQWINKEIDDKGATVITAKFQADATYSPALVLREVFSKEYYQGLLDQGYTSITFNLAIEGDITDLYIFGKPITSFVKNNGVYAVIVKLQHIVNHYDTINTLATSAKPAGLATSLSAKFISWKSPAEDYKSVRDYVFTISDVVLGDTAEPTFSVEFAEGSADTIYVNGTTTLEVNTNVAGDVVWSTSDETIATVANGVVTGVKAGEVTVTATLNGLTASKTVKVIYHNQIGARICGNDVSGQSQWLSKETGENGATVITAKFQADATYSPAITVRHLADKAVYEGMIAEGKTSLAFNLAVEGDVSDLYVFGKALNTFPEIDGVYAVVVSLQRIVEHYETIKTLATSANKAGQASSLSAKFISWKSPAGDYKSVRDYVFTISDVALNDTAEPTFSVEFAEGSADTIYTGETTTLEVNTNVAGDVVWSSSDETIATVASGVVTGVKAGEVTVTATLNGLTASKTVKVIYHNQIGARICGNDVSGQSQWLSKETGENGTTVITTKFQADATYSPALILKALAEKAVYQSLIAEGKTSLTFNLAVEGDVSDLYVFGKALNTFPEIDGVYAVVVSLQRIVEHYDTISILATSANKAGQESSLSAKFISWKSPAGDYKSVRDYVFTISDVALNDTAEPTFSVEFAEGSADTIYVNGTTTLEVNTNVAGDVVWSTSDETIATVANGVVTGVKAGEVTVTATLNGLTASKTVKVIYHNQIGARINGNDVTANSNYLQVTTDETGTTVITAKFQADATYSPALILKALAEKAVYESLIAEGKTSLTFNLAVEGDVSDLYVFGKALNTFPEIDGVYAVVVSLQRIVEHYDTINTLATSAKPAGQASSLSAKFISWNSPAGDYKSVRDYVFTISDVVLDDTAEPTFSVEFAEDSTATIYTGETTTLTVNTNVAGDVVWSTSDETIATVEDGVVTGVKAGEVTITATLNGLTASKTVKVIYHNQIGARICGNDVSGQSQWLSKETGENGATVITAKFQADATYSPALILKALAEKAVYQSLIAEGKTSLTFNLAVEGDVSDLYVFGKALNTFPEIDGVYAVVVSLQRIVEHYDTISILATSDKAAGQESSLSAKFISWKSPAGDYKSVREYVFTISEVVLDDTAEPTFSVEFAEGSADTIYTGETTTLEVNTNVAGDVVWSTSDETIATVEDGVVTGLKAGEVTITATLNGLTASKTVKVNYHNQIGVHAYGWDQTGDATYFNMSKSDNGETIIAVQFAGSTTHYPSLTLKEMYDEEYCKGLIAEGYAKLTFNLKVGGANASDVSDLYIFGKKLTNFAKNAEGVYAIVVDLQFMVDNYAKVSGMGTSVEAKNAEFEYMFLAWKSTDWTKRNYEFTFSNVSLGKGALFSDNIGMRVNGWNMTTNTTYMEMDVAADGAMTITANWQAYANYGPALVMKNVQSKEYYQGLINSGYTHLTFDLKVGGEDADKLDDIHILGSAQKVSACEQVDGVYKVQIQLAHIVQFYDTIVTLDTSGNQAGQWGSRSALLLAWRFSTNFATVPEDATRNYVFTISNTAFSKVN